MDRLSPATIEKHPDSRYPRTVVFAIRCNPLKFLHMPELILLAALTQRLPDSFPNFVLGSGQSPLRAAAFCAVDPASFWGWHVGILG